MARRWAHCCRCTLSVLDPSVPPRSRGGPPDSSGHTEKQNHKRHVWLTTCLHLHLWSSPTCLTLFLRCSADKWGVSCLLNTPVALLMPLPILFFTAGCPHCKSVLSRHWPIHLCLFTYLSVTTSVPLAQLYLIPFPSCLSFLWIWPCLFTVFLPLCLSLLVYMSLPLSFSPCMYLLLSLSLSPYLL